MTKIEELLEDCVRTCFSFNDYRPKKWCREIVIEKYWDVNVDRDEWSNFRFAIVDKLLRRIINYLRPEVVEELYN